MKQKNLKELSIEALQQKLKVSKLVMGLQLGMVIILLAAAVFVYVQTQETAVALPLFVVALGMLPISLIIRVELKKIEAEIASRNL